MAIRRTTKNTHRAPQTQAQKNASRKNWYIFRLRGCIARLRIVEGTLPFEGKIYAAALRRVYVRELDMIRVMTTAQFVDYEKSTRLIDF